MTTIHVRTVRAPKWTLRMSIPCMALRLKLMGGKRNLVRRNISFLFCFFVMPSSVLTLLQVPMYCQRELLPHGAYYTLASMETSSRDRYLPCRARVKRVTLRSETPQLTPELLGNSLGGALVGTKWNGLAHKPFRWGEEKEAEE